MSAILVEQSPSPMKLEVLGVDDWPIVTEPVGTTERYNEDTETSFIADGAGEITVKDEDPVAFATGDLVTVMPHTRCVWNITEAIERHYYKG